MVQVWILQALRDSVSEVIRAINAEHTTWPAAVGMLRPEAVPLIQHFDKRRVAQHTCDETARSQMDVQTRPPKLQKYIRMHKCAVRTVP